MNKFSVFIHECKELKYPCSIQVEHMAQRQYFIHGKIFEIRLEKMKGFL
jgi:hypothetical protein